MDTIRLYRLAGASGLPTLREAASGILAWLFSGRERARSRTMLASLDDRLLADIGLNRVDVARECDKPFWR